MRHADSGSAHGGVFAMDDPILDIGGNGWTGWDGCGTEWGEVGDWASYTPVYWHCPGDPGPRQEARERRGDGRTGI